MAVFEKVQEIIVEELGKDAEEVKVETTFDELDADSLDTHALQNQMTRVPLHLFIRQCHVFSMFLSSPEGRCHHR